jgi:hypothetical protein
VSALADVDGRLDAPRGGEPIEREERIDAGGLGPLEQRLDTRTVQRERVEPSDGDGERDRRLRGRRKRLQLPEVGLPAGLSWVESETAGAESRVRDGLGEVFAGFTDRVESSTGAPSEITMRIFRASGR